MKLELFMFDTCPYCRRVIDYLQSAGRTDVIFRNIHKSAEDAARLVEVGGKKQVPCLFIDGEPLYESMDIMKTWQENPIRHAETFMVSSSL